MKIVIAGSRSILEYELLTKAIIDSHFDVTSVISGHCKSGVDALGERWAKAHNLPICRMPGDWQKYGRAAGPIRNKEMAKLCDGAVILWDGESRGTKNMIDELTKLGKQIYVVVRQKK